MSENSQEVSLPFDAVCKTSTAKDKVFNFKWEIENFKTIADNQSTNKYLESDKFCFQFRGQQLKWRMRLYPSGTNETNAEWLTVYIMCKNKENPNEAKLLPEFCIIDANGNKLHTKLTADYDLLRPIGILLIKRADVFVPGSNLLKQGSLTLACKITVKDNTTVNRSFGVLHEDEEEVEDTSHHTKHMKEMLMNAEKYYSDVVIECDDGTIAAHTNVLAAGSDFFNALFASNMKERRNGKVELKYLNKSMCMTLLEFIYTGKVETNKISLNLFEESDKINLVNLKNKCCAHLIKTINIQNCVHNLIVADRHSDNKLKKAAKEFILLNYADLTAASKAELEKHPSLVMALFNDMHQQVGGNPPAKRQRTR